MLDQLFNIVKQFGQKSVVNNPEVPNEHNQAVLADATKTIASGFQNVLAGGGFGNILDLFRRKKTTQNSAKGGLLKNPIISMMIGYFISKLVGKYKMKPAAASNVANDLIPNSVNDLVEKTNDPDNAKATLDNLVNSLTGGPVKAKAPVNEDRDSPLQNLLDSLTGKDDDDLENGVEKRGFNLRDIIGNLTNKAQHTFQEQQQGGRPGIMDMIKGLMTN